MQAHHILKYSLYPALRHVVSNGICLCVGCHKIVTGNEEAYEAEFKRIIAMKRISTRNDKKNNPKKKPPNDKSRGNNKGRRKKPIRGKKKWKPKNTNLRY